MASAAEAIKMMLTIFLIAFAEAVTGTTQCLGPDGKTVDFWYAFKYPNGWDYAYMTSTHKLSKASGSMDGDSSPVSQTMAQLYHGSSKLSYALWNDEHPDGEKVKGPHAHAKGVIVSDKTSGFWITHSLPRFAAKASSGGPGWSATSSKYGQSFLCISMKAAEFKLLKDAFAANWPSVYDAADNAGLGDSFDMWAMDNKHQESPQTQISTIKSKGGHSFTAFGKTASWNDELYGKLVAKHFNKKFYTETWQNGVGRISSSCPQVQNVVKVQFPGSSWPEMNDHSKWAVSSDGKVFCVGDINRQTGQFNRGGGTICIENPSLGKQMLNVVDGTEDCGKETAVAETVIV